MSDEVDEVLGDGVHVGGVVLESGRRGGWWREITTETVPFLAVLIDQADVIVVLGSQLPVDDVRLVRRSERILGYCSKNVGDIL